MCKGTRLKGTGLVPQGPHGGRTCRRRRRRIPSRSALARRCQRGTGCTRLGQAETQRCQLSTRLVQRRPPYMRSPAHTVRKWIARPAAGSSRLRNVSTELPRQVHSCLRYMPWEGQNQSHMPRRPGIQRSLQLIAGWWSCRNGPTRRRVRRSHQVSSMNRGGTDRMSWSWVRPERCRRRMACTPRHQMRH